MSRRIQLDPANVRLLDDWGKALRSTFNGEIAYHVGSSFRGDGSYRDVDVRIILPNDKYEAIAAVMKPRRLNLMLTLWGRQVTGLLIDCQVQPLSFANDVYGKEPRNPLGLRMDDGIEGA